MLKSSLARRLRPRPLRVELRAAAAGAVAATALAVGLLGAWRFLVWWFGGVLPTPSTWELAIGLAVLASNLATGAAVAVGYTEPRRLLRWGAVAVASAVPVAGLFLLCSLFSLFLFRTLPTAPELAGLWPWALLAAVVGLFRASFWASVGREDGDQSQGPFIMICLGLCILFPPLLLLADALVFAIGRAAWLDLEDGRVRSAARAARTDHQAPTRHSRTVPSRPPVASSAPSGANASESTAPS